MSLAAALAAFAALVLGAGEPAATGRWHFVYDGAPALEYSVLFTRSNGADETRLLVRADAGRFELVSRQAGGEHDSTESVRDATTGELFTRRLLLSRYTDVAGCGAVAPPDACLLFTGSRGSVSTSLAAFARPDAAALRERITAVATPALAERLLALAPVFHRSVEFDAYTKEFLGLVWPERFDGSRASVSNAARRPGCDFDAGFGHPCSEEERRREKARFEPK